MAHRLIDQLPVCLHTQVPSTGRGNLQHQVAPQVVIILGMIEQELDQGFLGGGQQISAQFRQLIAAHGSVTG